MRNRRIRARVTPWLLEIALTLTRSYSGVATCNPHDKHAPPCFSDIRKDTMKRIILSAIVAGSMAVAANAQSQTSQAQASPSQSYGARSNGANAPTPYEGPTSYGTTAAANQQAQKRHDGSE